MKSRSRDRRGFAALSGPGGELIWGSLRPTEAAARQFFELHNPMRPVVIVPIRIKITEDEPDNEDA